MQTTKAPPGLACAHCGNEVARRGQCPLRFPFPDCYTDEAAAELKQKVVELSDRRKETPK